MVPDLGIAPPVQPTPAEMCPPGEDHNEQTFIDVDERVRIFVRTRWWRNQLIEFAITLQILVDGTWHEVMRADTCHREVHAHFFDSRGREKRERYFEVTDFASVSRGYDLCYERLLGTIEPSLRVWLDA